MRKKVGEVECRLPSYILSMFVYLTVPVLVNLQTEF
jgi:hypothetical protein